MSYRSFWICSLGAALINAAAQSTISFAEFDRRARAGERLTVCFFGASLTWGANATDPMRTSYRARVAQYLQKEYPQAHFTFVDGAIGGTNSLLGVFRLQRDCLRYHPDLVFLDFSANDDIRTADPEKLASYESLVRRILVEGKCPLIIMMFPFQGDARPGTADQMKGRIAHLDIARAYNVPVGDAILYIQDLVNRNPKLPAKIWNIDGVHPGDYGYRLFATVAWQALRQAIANRTLCQIPEKMLNADTYMVWSRNRLSQLEHLPRGWTPGYVSRTSAWYDGLMSRWLDDVVIARNLRIGKGSQKAIQVDPIIVKFKASTVLVFGEETVKSGKYMALIDDKPATWSHWGKSGTEWDLNSSRFGGGRQHVGVLATGLDPNQVHTLEIRPVFAEDKAQELRLESICLAGGEAKLMEVLAVPDKL